MSSQISLALTEDELDFLKSCFREAQLGASSKQIQCVLGPSTGSLSALRPLLAQDLSLNATQWRNLYDLIHAAVYGLGHFELSTLTGFTLPQAINFNLRIASKVWGVYGGSRF